MATCEECGSDIGYQAGKDMAKLEQRFEQVAEELRRYIGRELETLHARIDNLGQQQGALDSLLNSSYFVRRIEKVLEGREQMRNSLYSEQGPVE